MKENNNNKNVLCIIICIIVNNIDVPCNMQALTVNARIILQQRDASRYFNIVLRKKSHARAVYP